MERRKNYYKSEPNLSLDEGILRLPILGKFLAYAQRALDNLKENVFGERITVEKRKEAVIAVRESRRKEQQALKLANEAVTRYKEAQSQLLSYEERTQALERRITGSQITIGGEITTLEAMLRDEIRILEDRLRVNTIPEYEKTLGQLNLLRTNYQKLKENYDLEVGVGKTLVDQLASSKLQVEKLREHVKVLKSGFDEMRKDEKDMQTAKSLKAARIYANVLAGRRPEDVIEYMI